MKNAMKRMWVVCALLGLASPGWAQTGLRMRTPERHSIDPAERMADNRKQVVGEIRARMAVEARITTGAPYSAEAVTESTQVLADGNRIGRKSLTRVYRDTEGRTRREEVNDAGIVTMVSIVDPVAHVSYVLQPDSRTAYRENARIVMPDMMRSKMESATQSDQLVRVEPPPPPPAPPAPGALRRRPPPPPPAPGAIRMERLAPGSMSHEDLGAQDIEGVSATGTRTTSTIAAGAIGNLHPIKIVSEQWFSPDLQLLVMTKHNDPRTGDTTYRLQGLVRGEPDRSLFVLPADYTLQESGIRQPQQP
jgi:hypothetical protein